MADMNRLQAEIRREFQIPPFFNNASLLNYISEGEMQLMALNPNAEDFDKDLVHRNLLKNYCYYAYNHRVSEFFENYKNLIASWQLTTVAPKSEVINDE